MAGCSTYESKGPELLNPEEEIELYRDSIKEIRGTILEFYNTYNTDNCPTKWKTRELIGLLDAWQTRISDYRDFLDKIKHVSQNKNPDDPANEASEKREKTWRGHLADYTYFMAANDPRYATICPIVLASLALQDTAIENALPITPAQPESHTADLLPFI